MLRNKSTKVFSETNNFFISTEKGIYRIIEQYRSVKLYKISFGQKQAAQSTFEKSDLLLGLLLFPVYSIKNVHGYCRHALRAMLEAKKNNFFRFKNDSSINWRLLFNKINEIPTKPNDLTRCLIVDDIDFEKTTYKTEHISKIWSHIKHAYFFGFKELFLAEIEVE